MEPQTYRFVWQGITIEAVYTPLQWGVIAHLEVRSIAPARAPLPISHTNYRSHFHPPGTVESHEGDVVVQVTAWLDAEARKPAWKRWVAESRQGELF